MQVAAALQCQAGLRSCAAALHGTLHCTHQKGAITGYALTNAGVGGPHLDQLFCGVSSAHSGVHAAC